MENKDSICLLKECDSGTKMAVNSIDDVLDHVEDTQMYQLLSESKAHHERLGNEIHAQLLDYGSDEKDPSVMAKGMSWFHANMKMMMDESDSAIADLMTDGCNMGIKSLHKYLNQYPSAGQNIKDICKELIQMEDSLCKELRVYL